MGAINQVWQQPAGDVFKHQHLPKDYFFCNIISFPSDMDIVVALHISVVFFMSSVMPEEGGL